jgi:cytochrome c2
MRSIYLLLILMMFGVAACGAGAEAHNNPPTPIQVGDPASGQQIFVTRHGDAPPCTMCHVTDSDRRKMGAPSLQGIASRAGERVAGLDAAAYLRQSIVDPGAFDADPDGTTRMYAHYAEALTEEEISDLIGYLLTLK